VPIAEVEFDRSKWPSPDAMAPASSLKPGGLDPAMKKEMFRWVEEVTGTKVRSSRDFCDGTVLAALVQGLVDRASWEEHFRGAWSTTENYFTLDELPHATRLERAFEAWRRLYGVPEFLSAEAVAEDQVGDMALVVYLGCVRKGLDAWRQEGLLAGQRKAKWDQVAQEEAAREEQRRVQAQEAREQAAYEQKMAEEQKAQERFLEAQAKEMAARTRRMELERQIQEAEAAAEDAEQEKAAAMEAKRQGMEQEVHDLEQATIQEGRIQCQQASNYFNHIQAENHAEWNSVMMGHARSLEARRSRLAANSQAAAYMAAENEELRRLRNGEVNVRRATGLQHRMQEAAAREADNVEATGRQAHQDNLRRLGVEKEQAARVPGSEGLLDLEARLVLEIRELDSDYKADMQQDGLDSTLALEAAERELKAEEDDEAMLDDSADLGDEKALALQDRYLLDQRLSADEAATSPSNWEHQVRGPRLSPRSQVVAASQMGFMMG